MSAWTTLLLLSGLVGAADDTHTAARLMTALEYRYTGGGYQNKLFKYRLYIPPDANENHKLPMIVWLHGLSHAGSDNTAQLAALDRLILCGSATGRYPFFVLAVQCPADNPRWTHPDNPKKADDMVNVVAAILKQTLKDCPVDPDRVTMTGLSSGGSGCWAFAMRYPQYVAAIAPQAAGNVDTYRMNRLADVAVWAFHSTNDASAPINTTRLAVLAAQAAGSRAQLTEVDAARSRNVAYVGHDCWTTAFQEYHLLDWLLAQRKNQSWLTRWWTRPGTRSLTAQSAELVRHWRWWQLLVQASVLGCLAVAVWRLIRQRRLGARN